MNGERRSFGGVEIRQSMGGKPRLVGWAAVFGVRSLDLGGFQEQIQRGAFARSLRDKADMRAFVEHDPAAIIGRQDRGTLLVEEDERGLRVEITPPDTQVGRDVIENVRVGNLDQMSFAFRLYDPLAGQAWDFTQAPPLRTLIEVQVSEVSVVSLPAYPDTSVALRSLAEAQAREAGGPSAAEHLLELRRRALAWR